MIETNGSITHQITQFAGRGFTQGDNRLLRVLQTQAEAIAGIGNDFFDQLQVDQVAAVGTEKSAARTGAVLIPPW